MTSMMNTGVSGMESAQEDMQVIGDNIANVNTVGFKASRMSFEDSLTETLRAAGSTGSGSSSTGLELGTGVNPAATTTLFTQGSLTQTGVNTDLALQGDGFFLVKDASGAQYVTRAGDFHIDATTNQLVTNDGLVVQGYSDAGLTTQGGITIDETGKPATAAAGAVISNVSIHQDGEVWLTLSDGTSFRRGQILLQNFTNPSALSSAGGNLYTNLTAAGPQALAAPQSNGLGAVQSGELEMSNVDLASEFASLITAQRAFEANARVITTSDQVLQQLVALKQ